MTNGSKFEPRKQINRALKSGGVKTLNIPKPYINADVIRIFTSNVFAVCLE